MAKLYTHKIVVRCSESQATLLGWMAEGRDITLSELCRHILYDATVEWYKEWAQGEPKPE